MANITGTDGNDTLGVINYLEDDRMSGLAGNDYLYGGAGNDTLDGGSGNDRLVLVGDGSDIVSGSTGVDTLEGDYRNATSGLSMIYNPLTGSGNLTGGDAATTFSSIAAFRIYGSKYGDFLYGGLGADELIGNEGNDSLNSGSGNDSIYGNIGNDSLNSGSGNDSLYGNEGNDFLDGDLGNDTLFGDFGRDSLNGNAGNDQLYGFSDNDVLNGGAGRDILNGDAGDDRLIGAQTSTFGVGEIDTLVGGTDADRFWLASAAKAFYDDGNRTTAGLNDYAVINDFSAGDTIQLKRGVSYLLGSAPVVNPTGKGIFIDNDGVAGLSAKDELVGVVVNLNLPLGVITSTTPGFTFV